MVFVIRCMDCSVATEQLKYLFHFCCCCGTIDKLLPDSKYVNFVKYFSYCRAWGSVVVKALRY